MTDADDFFRLKAAELGYMKDDPHEPGNGRGLYAFYRDGDMQPPEYLEREIPKHEITGLIDDRAFGPSDRRSTRHVEGVS